MRRRIFVGCEGDGERSYIALVSRILNDVHQRVHLDPHVLQPGGGDPLDLVRRAGEEIERNERNREPYELKFLLIDHDKFGAAPERDQQMPALLRDMGATIVWQRPAREAFLLRHLDGCAARRPPTTAIAMQQLLQQWPEYEKAMSAMQLASRIDLDALRRAAAVEVELRGFLAAIEMF